MAFFTWNVTQPVLRLPSAEPGRQSALQDGMFLDGEAQLLGCRLVQEPAQLPGARPDASGGKGVFLVAFQNALLGERERRLSPAVGERERQTAPKTLPAVDRSLSIARSPQTPWILVKKMNGFGSQPLKRQLCLPPSPRTQPSAPRSARAGLTLFAPAAASESR